MRRLLSRGFFALLLPLIAALPARAQFLGEVQIQTVQSQLANAVTCTGNAQNFLTSSGIPNFNNLGQNQHQVSASSVAASFAVEIDGVDVLGTVIRISNPTVSFPAPGSTTILDYIAQGTGYYPNIQVSVTCTAGATFSMSYTGSSGGQTPFIAQPGTNPTIVPSFAGNVQGIVAPALNANTVFPIVLGGLQPAVNAGFLTLGVDNFSQNTATPIGGFTGNFVVGTPPAPSSSTDWGLVIYSGFGSTIGSGLNPPWICATSCGTNPVVAVATLPHVTQANKVTTNVGNMNGGINAIAQFLEFGNTPVVRQATHASSAAQTFGSGTLAGSTLVAAFECTAAPCIVDSVTDTQSNNWIQVQAINILGGSVNGQNVWITGPSSAAADTITSNAHAGTTVSNGAIVELTGTTPANPNTPNLQLFSAPGSRNNTNGVGTTGENDNGGLFTESGGYSFTATATFTTANTFVVSLWSQPNTGLFSSCVVSERITNIAGAATTLNAFLQDSADQVGWNDRLSMPQGTTVAGAQNFLGTIPAFTAGNLTATASSAIVSTNGTLAAGSAIAGPLGPFGRIVFVTTGAAVSVTVTYNVACK